MESWMGAGLIGLAIIHGFARAGAAADDAPGPADGSAGHRGTLLLAVAPEYSSGDYGESGDTHFWYVPFSARYELADLTLTPAEHDRIALKLTVPVIAIDGPGGVVGGTSGPADVRGRGEAGGGGSTVSRDDSSGLGDVLVQASYLVRPPADATLPWLTFSGTLKIPTASESEGLGTGAADYTLFSDVYRILGAFAFYVGGGYRFMGDSDEQALDDRWLAAAGFDVELASGWSTGLGYDYREAVTGDTSDAHELSPWVGYQTWKGLRVEPYGLIGLSSGSPDWGLGLRLSWAIRTGERTRADRDRDLP